MEKVKRHYRRWYDAFGDTVRILVATVVLTTFVILGVLAYAIVNTNNQIQNNIENTNDGVICILSNITGIEGITRPDRETTERACRRFIDVTEEYM